jgi:hypothetical protein
VKNADKNRILLNNKDSTPQLKKIDLDKSPVFVCDKTNKQNHDEIVKYAPLLLRLNSFSFKNF